MSGAHQTCASARPAWLPPAPSVGLPGPGSPSCMPACMLSSATPSFCLTTRYPCQQKQEKGSQVGQQYAQSFGLLPLTSSCASRPTASCRLSPSMLSASTAVTCSGSSPAAGWSWSRLCPAHQQHPGQPPKIHSFARLHARLSWLYMLKKRYSAHG